MIQSPYDRLANSLHRWKTIATDQGSKLAPDQKTAAASNYYDKMIAPIYKDMGAEPMPKELWMQRAFDSALKYDVSDSYHSSLVKGAIAGYASGMSTLDRVAGATLNMLGETVHVGAEGAKGFIESMAHPAGGMFPFFDRVRGALTTKPGEHFLDKVKKDAESIPYYGYMAKSVNQLASKDQFWHDVLPAQNFTEAATSVVVEQALQMPLYKGIGLGVRALGYAGQGVPMVANLTHALEATPTGRSVIPLLLAGTEGAVTGAALTAPGEDWKREAWQSALGFAVAHGAFSLAGKGFEGITSKLGRKTATLGDVVDGEAKVKYDAKIKDLELAKEGKHVMSPREEREAYKKVFANYVAAGGSQSVYQMFDEALGHIAETEKMSPEEAAKYRERLVQKDRTHYNPVFNVASSIQRMMGEGKVSELTSANKELLRFMHNRLVDQSASELVGTKPVQEVTDRQALDVSKTPAGQSSIKRMAANMQAKDAASGMNKNMTSEQYLQRAQQKYVENNLKAAAKAAKEEATKPLEEVLNAQKRRKDVVNPTKELGEAAGHQKVRSSYEYDAKGKVTGYSMSIGKDYKVYAQKASKQAGFEDIGKWVKDLSNEDFIADLQEWFYPKDLADAGFYFEHEAKDGTANNPNFLAFMYNYKDHMPTELASELRERLQDTIKVEKLFNPKIDIEQQLRYYALQMHSHVDDFLTTTAGVHKNEFNIFRSTLSDLLNPTKYQLELHTEKIAQERKNLQYMYQAHPVELKTTLAAYDKLAAERYMLLKQRYKSATKVALAGAERRQALDSQIADMQIGEKWRF